MDSFLTQVITQPTKESNILDLALFIVSDSDFIGCSELGGKLSAFDHHLIRFSVSIGYKLIDDAATIPDYKRTDFNLTREQIPLSPLEQLDFDVNTIENEERLQG